VPDGGTLQIAPLSARELFEAGELVAAARKEADACEKDGYWVTAGILRDLADKVEAREE